MYGISTFGTVLYSEASTLAEFVPSEAVTFNTYGLQNPGQYGVHVSGYTIDTPNRDFSTASVPGGHGLILQEDWYRGNPITLSGWVSQPTKIQMDQKIHEIMRNLHGVSGTLSIDNGGNFKEIQTTLQSADFENEHYSTTRKEFTFTFSGVKAFWQDSAYSSSAIFDSTDLSIDGTMNNAGSVESDQVMIVIFSTATDVSGVTFTNTKTGEEVSITETITAGDVLIFDGEEKTATLNGMDVEFSGAFPKLQIGLNTYTIDIVATSSLVDVTAKWKNQYLTP